MTASMRASGVAHALLPLLILLVSRDAHSLQTLSRPNGQRHRVRSSPAMRMPDAVRALLPAGVREHAIFNQAADANWEAIRACYPSEEAALEAIKECTAIILPYGADSMVSGFYELGMAVDRSDKIAGSYEVLQSKLDSEAEVLEIVTKNPGVLGCQPTGLETASADDIRRGASLVSGANTFFGPARRFVQSASWWDEGLGKTQEPSPAATEEDDPDAPPMELPEIVLDGVSYMYDFKGSFMGIQHLLLDDEGEAVAVWDPETEEVQELQFVEEGEEGEDLEEVEDDEE